MRFVTVGDKVVNLAQVALVEKEADIVYVHLAAPETSPIPGARSPLGDSPPMGANHIVLRLTGEDATAFWKAVQSA